MIIQEIVDTYSEECERVRRSDPAALNPEKLWREYAQAGGRAIASLRTMLYQPVISGMAVGLSPREVQVLDGMSRGKTNTQIGQELDISGDTVKAHATRVFRKLEAKDRAHAVAIMYQLGIFPSKGNTC